MDEYKLYHSLVKGDVKKIAAKTGYCREYTGKVLSPAYNFRNENIVNAAIEVVTERQNKINENRYSRHSI